jgi:hypothetical protein
MRNLHSDAYQTNRAQIKRLDNDVFNHLTRLRAQGRTFVRAGEIARLTSVDSCQALGSFERLKSRLRRAGMI